jgi:hypothetical protein
MPLLWGYQAETTQQYSPETLRNYGLMTNMPAILYSETRHRFLKGQHISYNLKLIGQLLVCDRYDRQMRWMLASWTPVSRECCANTKFALDVGHIKSYANGAPTSRRMRAHHIMLLLALLWYTRILPYDPGFCPRWAAPGGCAPMHIPAAPGTHERFFFFFLNDPDAFNPSQNAIIWLQMP